MKFIVPAIVFLGSSLWGHINGDIPFTGIQTSNSITQRILGSFQLASSAYAISDFLPLPLASTTSSANTSQVSDSTGPPTPPDAPPVGEDPTITRQGEQEKPKSSQTLLIILVLVNSVLLVRLTYARIEDRAEQITYSRNQTAHIVRLLDQQTEILPVMGIYMLQQLDEKFDLIEGSIQRLQARFEKVDPTVQELEEYSES